MNTAQQTAQAITAQAKDAAKRVAWDASADLLESLARGMEEGEDLTPRKLRTLARAFRKEANK